MIGVDQVNLRIPVTVREGCGVPLHIYGGETTSQPVPVAIRKGGGQCVDPPSPGYGLLIWEKTATSGTSSDGTVETFTAMLDAWPGQNAPPMSKPGKAPPLLLQYWKAYPKNIFEFQFRSSGPTCPLPGYRPLDAGPVTVQGPGSDSITAQKTLVDNHEVYRANLPPGTIRPGQFQVNAGGGGDVGAFSSNVQIGSEIKVTSEFPPGTVWPYTKPILVTWTGGDPDASVAVTLLTHQGSESTQLTATPIPNSVGQIDGWVPVLLGVLPGPAEIIIEVSPDPAKIATFSAASGLGLGGRHTWKYTYRLAGFRIE
jgi:hypothetical protein